MSGATWIVASFSSQKDGGNCEIPSIFNRGLGSNCIYSFTHTSCALCRKMGTKGDNCDGRYLYQMTTCQPLDEVAHPHFTGCTVCTSLCNRSSMNQWGELLRPYCTLIWLCKVLFLYCHSTFVRKQGMRSGSESEWATNRSRNENCLTAKSANKSIRSKKLGCSS